MSYNIERLADAVDGKIPLDALTDDELVELQQRIMYAIAEKHTFVFEEHDTVQ